MNFSERCYLLLKKIPAGTVVTYKDIAHALGGRAYRAVGSAMRKNPCAPLVPCHRVISSDGKIGNYSGNGGVQKKILLLKKEGVVIENGKIDLERFGFSF